MKRFLAALGAALLVVGLAACGAEEPGPLQPTPGDNHGYHGTYLPEAYQVPAQVLTDTDGESFDLAADGPPIKLFFFGYTKCPDICHVVMATLASAMNRLDDDVRSQVTAVFVTTDPARDTGPVLRDYLDRLDPEFIGLTGSLEAIIEAGKPLKVFIEDGKRLPSGGYEVEHSTHVVAAVGDEGRVIWTQGFSPASAADDIERLVKEEL